MFNWVRSLSPLFRDVERERTITYNGVREMLWGKSELCAQIEMGDW
ncbi:MAG: hypothetical protein ACTS6H_00175 [Candidatus Hodgkinia cicadicola]